MSCDDPDCAGCRLSKKKWSHDAFVPPPYPPGVNPYVGYPPVFGSQMSARAAARAAADEDNDEPSSFVDSPGSKSVSISPSILLLTFYANDNTVNILFVCAGTQKCGRKIRAS